MYKLEIQDDLLEEGFSSIEPSYNTKVETLFQSPHKGEDKSLLFTLRGNLSSSGLQNVSSKQLGSKSCNPTQKKMTSCDEGQLEVNIWLENPLKRSQNMKLRTQYNEVFNNMMQFKGFEKELTKPNTPMKSMACTPRKLEPILSRMEYKLNNLNISPTFFKKPEVYKPTEKEGNSSESIEQFNQFLDTKIRTTQKYTSKADKLKSEIYDLLNTNVKPIERDSLMCSMISNTHSYLEDKGDWTFKNALNFNDVSKPYPKGFHLDKSTDIYSVKSHETDYNNGRNPVHYKPDFDQKRNPGPISPYSRKSNSILSTTASQIFVPKNISLEKSKFCISGKDDNRYEASIIMDSNYLHSQSISAKKLSIALKGNDYLDYMKFNLVSIHI